MPAGSALPPQRGCARLRPAAALRLVLAALAAAALGAAPVDARAPGGREPRPPRGQSQVSIPSGTELPIRFLHRLTGGRDGPGTPVLVQTLGALVSDGCVVVDPFTQLLGRVTRSRGGARFGRPGELALQFDSLQLGPRRWAPVAAMLDSVEYAARSELSGGGSLAGGRHPGPGRLLRTGAVVGVGALAEEVVVIPVALLEGWRLVRRGPRADILAGEVARVHLTRPLLLPAPATCVAPDLHPDLTQVPALPSFTSRTVDDRAGRHPGDPINVLLLGARDAIGRAFAHAGWVPAEPPSLWSLARGITAALIERSAVGAPVSTQYFAGRRQDAAFELSGPNARFRHHLRLWKLDDGAGAWVAAADQDVGLLVNPFRGTATHRIARDVDVERDLVVRELEATGCADLLQYITSPGAALAGRNASGQAFQTDGRTAVIRVRACT